MHPAKLLLAALVLSALLASSAEAAAPTQLSAVGTIARDATAVAGSDGGRTVAWLQSPSVGDAPEILFTRLAADGTPGPVVAIPGSSNGRDPALVAQPDGDVLALWDSTPAGEMLSTAYIHPDGTIDQGPAVDAVNNGPIAAVTDSGGRTTIAWRKAVLIKGDNRAHLLPYYAQISPSGKATRPKRLTKSLDDVVDLELTVVGGTAVRAAWTARDEFFDHTEEVLVRNFDAKGKAGEIQKPFDRLAGSESVGDVAGRLIAITSSRKGKVSVRTGSFAGKDGLGKLRKGSTIRIKAGRPTGARAPKPRLTPTGSGATLGVYDEGVRVFRLGADGKAGESGLVSDEAAGWRVALATGPGGAPTVVYSTDKRGPDAATLTASGPVTVAEQLLEGATGPISDPEIAAGPQAPPAIVWTAHRAVFAAAESGP